MLPPSPQTPRSPNARQVEETKDHPVKEPVRKQPIQCKQAPGVRAGRIPRAGSSGGKRVDDLLGGHRQLCDEIDLDLPA